MGFVCFRFWFYETKEWWRGEWVVGFPVFDKPVVGKKRVSSSVFDCIGGRRTKEKIRGC